jgi:hypothetical protein
MLLFLIVFTPINQTINCNKYEINELRKMIAKPVTIIKRASIPAAQNKQAIHHNIFREGLK